MISVHPDPTSAEIIERWGLRIPALAFDERFPGLAYRIVMLPSLPNGKEAVTDFSSTDRVPVIGLLPGLPVELQRRRFVHELAHVAAGLAAEHGDEWQCAEDAIHIAAAAIILR